MQGMWLPASRVDNWSCSTQTLIHWFPSCDINFLFASTATISSELVLVAVWVHQNSRLCSKVNKVKLLGESQYTPPFGDDVSTCRHLLARIRVPMYSSTSSFSLNTWYHTSLVLAQESRVPPSPGSPVQRCRRPPGPRWWRAASSWRQAWWAPLLCKCSAMFSQSWTCTCQMPIIQRWFVIYLQICLKSRQ